MGSERVSCPQWIESMFLPCHSHHEWETAPRNAPLSSYQQHWGGWRASSLPSLSSVQNHVCEGAKWGEGRGDTGLQTFDRDCEASSPTHQTLHFLICLGQASFLSAINLQLHPPIFIPFPIFITGSPSPLVQLALGRFTLGLITVHRCTHASNNGLLGPLSATFYRARRASCWPSHYYASAVQQCFHSAPRWPSWTPHTLNTSPALVILNESYANAKKKKAKEINTITSWYKTKRIKKVCVKAYLSSVLPEVY